MSAAYIEGSHNFKVEKESLWREIDKLKGEYCFRQGSETDTKLAELRQTHNADVRALNKKLRYLDLFTAGV